MRASHAAAAMCHNVWPGRASQQNVKRANVRAHDVVADVMSVFDQRLGFTESATRPL
jgi:hypothetical protein